MPRLTDAELVTLAVMRAVQPSYHKRLRDAADLAGP
jgi:hypothetical protein